jgi:hypothetical protein
MKQSIIAIFSITTLLFTSNANGQRIAGYDIIGSKEEVLGTFNKLGLNTIKSASQFTILSGKLQNESVQMYFYHTPMSTQIYKVEVFYPSKTSSDSSKISFNKRLSAMTNRYGVPENVICSDGSKLNHAYNNLIDTDILKMEWVTMPYFQNLSLFAELLKSGEVKVTYIVKNNALKYEQEIKMLPSDPGF